MPMPKIISLIIILLISQNLLSQNKKEQIQILSKSLDSIKTLLTKERNDFSILKSEYEQNIYKTKLEQEANNNKIESLSKQLDSNYLKMNDLIDQLTKSDLELATLKSQITNYQASINKAQNEISELKLSNVKNDYIDSLYSIDFKTNKVFVNNVLIKQTDSTEIYNGKNKFIVSPMNFNEDYMNLPRDRGWFESLFIACNAGSFNNENIKIKITVKNNSKTIMLKEYYWHPIMNGNFYIWLDLDDEKYFTCNQRTNIKIELVSYSYTSVKEDKIIFSNTIKYDGFCECQY